MLCHGLVIQFINNSPTQAFSLINLHICGCLVLEIGLNSFVVATFMMNQVSNKRLWQQYLNRKWRIRLLVFKSFSSLLQGERATGFGVALLMALFGQASDDSMLNQVSPLGATTNASEDHMERDCKRRRLV